MRRPIGSDLPVVLVTLALLVCCTPSPAVAERFEPSAVDAIGESHARVSSGTPDPGSASVNGLEPLAVPGPPADPDVYRMGPGDQLLLNIPGVLRQPLSIVVDAEGNLLLPGQAGSVPVAGLTLSEARAAASQALRREYRQRPFTLSLVTPRIFKVFVTGQVARPGSYVAGPMTRVSELVEAAGGVERGGSERRILVTGVGGQRREADLLAFARRADRRRNPFVEGGDVIGVPAATEFFTIHGGVALPGRYELGPGDTLGDALALAGGVFPDARPERTEWRRLVGERLGESTHVDLTDRRVARQPLGNGDALHVPIDGNRAMAAAHVIGEVRSPGVYRITPGVDSAATLLERAGGWGERANRTAARLLRPPARPDKTGPAPEPMVGLDRTRVEDEGLRLALREWPRQVPLALDSAGRPGADLLLENGDILYVPASTGRVLVDGRVRRPGFVSWAPGRSIDEYVTMAGGFDRDADRGRLLIQRTGRPGELERASGSSPIGDGDVLWVPEKETRSAWQVTREVVALMAQAATVAIVIREAVR